ncbi:ABC transporter transmembrane domain-containing protein [Paenibacillus sp. J2TS4]|uniref:ABC transporter transmembrane domain-containing protein n=1 Tax=Paenibacillus sp. J2TS4 TaxID=2807194 RepID=UPI001B17E1AA|nr:ABC transporter transmembrane domain-containing protein [Paenibacillus sp. J2TS4]GIP35672.1 multidrug ABC transporter permease/ATP-binding protein [Paenibacillus sp. J2TS4]
MRVFIDLMWFFRMEKARYIGGIFTLVVVSLLILLPPYVIGVMVDGIAAGTLSGGAMVRWLLFLAVIGVLMYGLRYVWRVMIYGSAARLSQVLRNRLYQHFTSLSPRFYQQKRTGDLMAHATNDILAIELTAGEGVLTLVDSLVMGLMVIATMALFIDWKLTLVALLPMPFIAWSTSYYGNLLHERFHAAQAAFSTLNDKVQENISGVRVVKAFGQEEEEKKGFRHLSEQAVEKNVAVAKIDALFDPTISLIVGLSFFLAIAYGAKLVVGGELSLGGLTQFTIYLGHLIWPMLAIGYLFNIMERGRASYERVQSLLMTKSEVQERENAETEPPQGDLEVAIASFYYPGYSEPALTGIEFRLERGMTLGLVGRLGSGKTTLLRLLLREFDGVEGDIAIGGKSIYDFRLEALRRSIGYVPQEHVLFSATIAENIAFGLPEATAEEIEAAARIAAVHDDIVRFPDGYETVVGERGVTLSGGQKQRLSIARALLMQPELLLLDDALSAVDARTEKAIIDSLGANRRQGTTLIAAHRLSAVERADLILVLDEGRLAESGTHQQLMAAGGWYAEMYRRQQLESLVMQGGAEHGRSPLD